MHLNRGKVMNTLWHKIQHQVEECAKKIGLVGLALASEDGLLIASSGHAMDAELVAAVSPNQEQNEGALHQIRAGLHQSGLQLEIMGIRRGQRSLFLCATGADGRCNHPDLQMFLQEMADKVGLEK